MDPGIRSYALARNPARSRHDSGTDPAHRADPPGEDDYSARGFGVSGEWDLNNKLSTLSAGFSFSDDEIKPVDALKFGRIEKGKKQTRLKIKTLEIPTGEGRTIENRLSVLRNIDSLVSVIPTSVIDIPIIGRQTPGVTQSFVLS